MGWSVVTLRWQDYHYYDVECDENVIRLMAITNIGTWWTELVEGMRGNVARRRAFKEAVIRRIEAGETPEYVDLNEETV